MGDTQLDADSMDIVPRTPPQQTAGGGRSNVAGPSAPLSNLLPPADIDVLPVRPLPPARAQTTMPPGHSFAPDASPIELLQQLVLSVANLTSELDLVKSNVERCRSGVYKAHDRLNDIDQKLKTTSGGNAVRETLKTVLRFDEDLQKISNTSNLFGGDLKKLEQSVKAISSALQIQDLEVPGEPKTTSQELGSILGPRPVDM